MKIFEYSEQKNLPSLSFDEAIGTDLKHSLYTEYPHDEVRKIPEHVQVIFDHTYTPSVPLPTEGICLLTVCLDASGRVPEKLPMHPAMKGHEISVIVYRDPLNCIRMIAVGGFTSFENKK